MLKRETPGSDDSSPSYHLSLSHFNEKCSSEEQIEFALMQRFRFLEELHGGAFERRAARALLPTKGEHDAVARTLNVHPDGRIAVLVVSGHGQTMPLGVQLADRVWNGSEVWQIANKEQKLWTARGALELSRIDFLVQITCSIGRLSHGAGRDVDGFCTELFMNRARSVQAGRWELNAEEAIGFATEVIERYLDNVYRSQEEFAILSITFLPSHCAE